MQAETKPRYTVELTTEGWQIKDNRKNVLTASIYNSKRNAEEGCQIRAEADAHEEQKSY